MNFMKVYDRWSSGNVYMFVMDNWMCWKVWGVYLWGFW